MGKILVTGATGYLGSRLVAQLLAQGHEVAALKRANSSLAQLGALADRVRWYDVEAEVATAFLDEVRYDAVFHLATSYGRKKETVEEVVRANLTWPLSILRAAQKHAVKYFFNADTTLPRELNAYTLSKAQFADWGRRLSAGAGTKFINLKFQHFYGPGESVDKFISFLIAECLRQVSDPIPMTHGEQIRDFIYIDDAISALLELYNHAPALDQFSEVEVGSGQGVTIANLAKTIARLTATRRTLGFGLLPYRPGEPMCLVADHSHLTALAWSPRIGLEDGLNRMIQITKG